MSKREILFGLLLMAWGAARGEQPWTLDACVDYALSHSPQLEQDALAPEKQELTTTVLRQKFAWLLDLDSGYESVDGETRGGATVSKELPGSFDLKAGVTGKDGGDDGASGQSYVVRLNKLLLGGGSVRASMLAVDNSVLQEAVSLNGLSLSRRRLANRITTLYYQVIRDVQTQKVRKMQQERGLRNLEHAQEREEPLDIATAELDVKENAAAVLRSERAILSSLDRLKEEMGLDIQREIELASDVAYTPEEVDVLSDLATCLAEHETILNQLLQIRQVENELWARKRKILPAVNLGGAVRRDDSEKEQGDTEYTVGLDLSWEFGSVSDRARAKRLAYSLREEELGLTIIQREKQREVLDLGRRLVEQQRQVELSQERIAVQERRIALYRDRWDNGEIDILEYVRSQNDLENSRVTLVTQATTYMGLLSDYRLATVTDQWSLKSGAAQ